jgi:5-methylcytosine-specific restriction enzyme A
MALLKFCPGCRVMIEAGNKYCNECWDKKDKQQKTRHRKYKQQRTDIKEQRFYLSREWIATKTKVISTFKGMCLYSYYIDDRIVPCNTVHHIEELKDSWDRRLDLSNLIPLTERNHQRIHEKYKNGFRRETQAMQYKLLVKWQKEFGRGY